MALLSLIIEEIPIQKSSKQSEDTTKFIKQFDREFGCRSVEYGMKYWLNNEDYGDINMAMVKSLESYKVENYPKLKQKARDKKIAQIRNLMKEVKELE